MILVDVKVVTCPISMLRPAKAILRLGPQAGLIPGAKRGSGEK